MISKLIGFWVSKATARRLKQFNKKLDRCREVQTELLKRILSVNAASEFGREHGFDKISNYSDFVKSVPLSNYSYVEPYIEKCKRGQTDALFGGGQEILMFALTSGTTSAAKFIPVTKKFLESYRRGWDIWGIKAISDHSDSYLRKILQVTSSANEQVTESGIPCGAISGMLAQNQRYIVRKYYVTPYEVAEIENAADKYYTIMRLAIIEDVAFISTANPSTALTLAQTAEREAERLIRDVHDGTLDEGVSIPRALRAKLRGRLPKRPGRAGQLEEILQEKGRLLPRDFWDLSFLANWTGGTLGMYMPRLLEYYGAVPIRDIGLLASEGRMSIPLEDNTAAGVLDITSNFYEFVLQEEMDSITDVDSRKIIGDDGTPLQSCQIEKGKCYYIFLTNWAGLYRYNIGDLVRVVDFVKETPVVEFLSKGAHSSSITGEKLTERQVVEAVHRASDDLAIRIDTFVMMPQWDDPPRYRFYFEMAAAAALPQGDLRHLAGLIDRRLQMSNIEYDAKQESGRLGKLDIRQVPSGFLTKRDERLLQAKGGRREQFKHRYLYNEPTELD